LLWIGIFALPLGGQSAFAYEESLEHTFRASAGGELAIRSDRGSIEVTPGEDGEVHIEIVPGGSLKDVADIEDEFDIRFDRSGNRVSLDIASRRDEGVFRWFRWDRARIHIRVRVPSRFSAELNTAGGSIAVDGLQGKIQARTSGGSLSFGRIEGPIHARTSGGSIRLLESAGDADLKTSGGRIRLEGVNGNVVARTSGGPIIVEGALGSVVASTSGGNIRVDGAMGPIEARTSGGSVTASIHGQPEGDCYLKTSGGSVTVHLAPDLGFRIDAKTSAGRVRSDLALRDATQTRSRLQGVLNSGGPELRLRTSGGSIRILQMR